MVTARVYEDCGAAAAKVAITVLFWFMVTVHLFTLVLSHPDQLVKVDPLFGIANRVNCIALARFTEQVVPQFIPDPVMVPLPLPVPSTFRL